MADIRDQVAALMASLGLQRTPAIVLAVLIAPPRTVRTYDAIADAIEAVTSREASMQTVQRAVSRARKAIDPDRCRIVSAVGIGYRAEADDAYVTEVSAGRIGGEE